MLHCDRFELGDDLVGAAEREPRLRSRRDRGQPELPDPGNLALREVLEPRVGERLPAPKRKRLVEQLTCPLRIGPGQLLARPTDEPLETLQVEPTRRHAQHVATRRTANRLGSELLPQPGDILAHRVRRTRRGRAAPHRVH